MGLGPEFIHLEHVVKHGDPSRPGYKILHPGGKHRVGSKNLADHMSDPGGPFKRSQQHPDDMRDVADNYTGGGYNKHEDRISAAVTPQQGKSAWNKMDHEYENGLLSPDDASNLEYLLEQKFGKGTVAAWSKISGLKSSNKPPGVHHYGVMDQSISRARTHAALDALAKQIQTGYNSKDLTPDDASYLDQAVKERRLHISRSSARKGA